MVSEIQLVIGLFIVFMSIINYLNRRNIHLSERSRNVMDNCMTELDSQKKNYERISNYITQIEVFNYRYKATSFFGLISMIVLIMIGYFNSSHSKNRLDDNLLSGLLILFSLMACFLLFDLFYGIKTLKDNLAQIKQEFKSLKNLQSND